MTCHCSTSKWLLLIQKIQTLITRKKEEEAGVTKSLAELEKDRKTNLGEIEETFERTKGVAEEQQSKLQQDLKESEQAQDAFNESIEDAVENAENLGTNIDAAGEAVDAQIGKVADLASQYRIAADEAARMADEVRDANTRASGSGAGTGRSGASSSTRASGGPVSGGSAYTVNELGKEAFLSASGALSMINAPAWGTWRAPSSGTVIPAHLTSQLDVPSGGVNINKTSNASAASGGGMSMSRMVSAIAGALGGDTVTNNVTIQSANTTQAASDVMVQLAKLKRLRYN